MGADTSTTRGSIEIYGNGEASSAPELATLSVSVVSVCYDSSRAAVDANAELANRVLKVLESYKKDKRDRIVATGGPSLRHTEYVDLGEGKRKVLCERKWKSTNLLTLRMADLKAVSDLQDAVLKAVGSEDITPTRVAQTYAQLSQPGFTVYPETQTRLRTEAQKRAWQDAKAQFDGFQATCRFRDVKLTTISPPSYHGIPKFAEAPMPHAAPQTPVIPDELTMRVSWRFVWTFEPGGECFMFH
jgi:uncharacterized protein YggE